MPPLQWFIVLGIGVAFILGGIILILVGRKNEANYFNDLANNADARKYIERRSLTTFISLKVGGKISLIVGIVLLSVEAVLWYLV